MVTTKSAVGYIRVSTTHQAQNGISLENQKKRIHDYCKYKGYELLEIIEDAGVSGGGNKNRNGFLTLLDKIEQNSFDVLILLSLERLSRDMVSLMLIEKFLSDHNTELHTIEGQIDTSSPDGFLSFAMKAFLSEMERRYVSQRTASAMGLKKSQGLVAGNVPFGFRRKENSDQLVEDKKEQIIIKLANKLYSKGYKLKDIVQELNGQGYTNRVGNKWVPVRVSALIKDYKGSFVKSKKKSSVIMRNYLELV